MLRAGFQRCTGERCFGGALRGNNAELAINGPPHAGSRSKAARICLAAQKVRCENFALTDFSEVRAAFRQVRSCLHGGKGSPLEKRGGKEKTHGDGKQVH
jgi:hypothetical protein